MKYLNDNPEWMVIDVGANIGQYSLFSAKFGRKVLAIEPFIENIYRLHKAAKLESIEGNIVLLQNAVSDLRNEVKLLAKHEKDIGGQSLLPNKDQVYKKDPNNTYLVETIWLDDIIPYLPKQANRRNFKRAIMKIDIEGFEPFAFQRAVKLFRRLDVRIVIMEWRQMPNKTEITILVEEMIDFFLERGYKPHDPDDKPLLRKYWRDWPVDIIWIKKHF